MCVSSRGKGRRAQSKESAGAEGTRKEGASEQLSRQTVTKHTRYCGVHEGISAAVITSAADKRWRRLPHSVRSLSWGPPSLSSWNMGGWGGARRLTSLRNPHMKGYLYLSTSLSAGPSFQKQTIRYPRQSASVDSTPHRFIATIDSVAQVSPVTHWRRPTAQHVHQTNGISCRGGSTARRSKSCVRQMRACGVDG